MLKSELAFRKAAWAERLADKNASEDNPWSLRNVRLYQNLMSKWLGEAYALRKLGQ